MLHINWVLCLPKAELDPKSKLDGRRATLWCVFGDPRIEKGNRAGGSHKEQLCVAHSQFRPIIYYPPGSKCEALQLGVHLILLYFIRILLSIPEIFILFGWWMVGGGWRTFLFFKSLDNNTIYCLGIRYIWKY